MAQLEALMRRNFVDYASYAILDRAIPDLRDGLKPVQRRILHTLFSMHDGRYHKVANVIGETMKLHPHGDASIGEALVVLANKGFFIDRQGNFGSVLTGHPAAAARYIECRLAPLALEGLFEEALTEMRDSYDGRSREPVFLPAKLPVALMLGADGIAVGMATRILPHNLAELWRAQIAILRGEDFELLPDFPQGGLADASAYDDGRGKVEIRARIETPDEKRVVIRELPFGTTTESLIASIEAAVQRKKLAVASIDDFTTDRVEIQLTLPRGVRAKEVVPKLYAHSDCAVSVSSNIVLIDERRPVVLSASETLRAVTELLVERLRAELEWERGKLEDRRHWLTLEQIFVEERVYQRLEEAASQEELERFVREGMQAHRERMLRDLTDDDVARLLRLEIRRISAFDKEKHRGEVAAVEEKLAAVVAKLGDIVATTIAYVEDLLERHGERFPRRTQLTRFSEIDRKAVARQGIALSYDPKTGLFGSQVKGSRFELSVSEIDPVLAISDDGSYRVLTAPEKVFIPGKLVHCAPFDPKKGFALTLVYRDAKKLAFGKRVRIERFVKGREYRLVKDPKGRVDLLLPDGEEGIVSLHFVPAKRQRVKASRYDLTKLEPTGVGARGTRLAAKPVARVKLLARKPRRPAAPTPEPVRGEQATLF